MTTKEIEALLAKYYDGETSLNEEHLLKNFFKGDSIPDHLMAHQPLFKFTSTEAKTEVSSRFDQVLQERIGTGKVVPMNPFRKHMALSLSLAASIVLIAGLITLFRLGVFMPSQPYGTITDPELAYVEVRNALYTVSSNLNSGLEKMKPLESFSVGYDQVQNLQKFKSGLETMSKINQLDKYQPFKFNQGRKTN